MTELDAIEVGSRLWRALFLHDEVDQARQRYGAVLAKRNVEHLKAIKDHADAVLKDARVTEDGAGDDTDGTERAPTAAMVAEPMPAEPDEDPTVPDIAALLTMRAALQPNRSNDDTAVLADMLAAITVTTDERA